VKKVDENKQDIDTEVPKPVLVDESHEEIQKNEEK